MLIVQNHNEYVLSKSGGEFSNLEVGYHHSKKYVVIVN